MLFLISTAGLAWLPTADARVRQIPFSLRWLGEDKVFDKTAAPEMTRSSLGGKEFATGIAKRPSEQAARLTERWIGQGKEAPSSVYNQRLTIDDAGDFATGNRFAQPLFLKNPGGEVVYGRSDVMGAEMNQQWNGTFTEFFAWWSENYQEDLEDEEQDLSLRDINRYQFRRSRSGEAGFPVQEAGGEPES